MRSISQIEDGKVVATKRGGLLLHSGNGKQSESVVEKRNNSESSRNPALWKVSRQGTVNSYCQEFGYELLSTVPQAYMLSLEGKLKETISAKGSSALYYFSPKHTEVEKSRAFHNTVIARRQGAPYVRIHTFERPDLTYPPYKEYYANDEFKWDKPTLCICNRYNVEWNKPPINYFTPEILDTLFGLLSEHYTVVYFAVDLPDHLQDMYPNMALKDLPVARKHNVKVFQDFKGDWNTNLMKVFANCEHYITMNGGYSIMASYFSGNNIIYTKTGRVQTKEINKKSFWRWYPNINGVRTLVTLSYDELLRKVKDIYVDKIPVANVYTDNIRVLPYLLSQDYKNINIIFHAKRTNDVVLSRKYNVRMVREKPKMDLIEIYEPVSMNHITETMQI